MKVRNILMVFALLLSLFSCNKEEHSSLMLDGDVQILALQLDGYNGVIDLKNRTVRVAVPNTYDVSAMKVTQLTLTDGAYANIAVGEQLNCNLPVDLRVKNGDVHLDYVLTVVPDFAQITEFMVNGKYYGRIDDAAGTIKVVIPATDDITQCLVDIKTNEGAIVNPASGAIYDFTEPVSFTVTFGTASKTYVASITQVTGGDVAFVGTAATVDDIESMEEKTAAKWLLANVPMSEYISFESVANGTVNLNSYKVVWWHHHNDNGDNPATPASAVDAIFKFQNYYLSGGNLLLSRYASFYIANDADGRIKGIGIANDGRWPNNSWGGNENSPEITGGAWSFFISEGQEDHPIYQGLETGEDQGSKIVYTCDAGYGITNSTAQWHIGADWGGYAGINAWREATGGTDLGHGGDGAVVLAEWPSTGGSGRVVVIGSGAYDWYSSTMDAFSDKYHKNVEKMTLNAINYLKGE